LSAGVRWLCLHCDNFSLCETCYNNPSTLPRHDPTRSHVWAKIKDSRSLTSDKLESYRRSVQKEPVDAYAFHTWKKAELKDNEKAFDLIKEMLRLENSYRLGEEYQTEYKKSQDDEWKTQVTVDIQARVVNEFMDRAQGIYETLDEGLNFLRAAVGNFGEDHLHELMECANYVKYTQVCVRGDLRLGDKVDLTQFPLIDPHTLKQELLSDWMKDNKPLVILASSYT